jgi:deazaflavin-dependent oxidoreductase (nitroreductase family)
MTDANNGAASMANDINAFNKALIEEFRANNGKVTGMFAQAPLMLLTQTGAKSGQLRTSPLVYSCDGDRIVIIASKAGSPAHPHWYLNIVANPSVTVELPGEKFAARAVITSGDERARLYRAQADLMPNFDEYAAKTDREIPVVILERV